MEHQPSYVRFELPYKPTVEQLADFQAKLGVNFKYIGSKNCLYVYTMDPLSLEKVEKTIMQNMPADAEIGWECDEEDTHYQQEGDFLGVIRDLGGNDYDVEMFDIGASTKPIYQDKITGTLRDAQKVVADFLVLANKDWTFEQEVECDVGYAGIEFKEGDKTFKYVDSKNNVKWEIDWEVRDWGIKDCGVKLTSSVLKVDFVDASDEEDEVVGSKDIDISGFKQAIELRGTSYESGLSLDKVEIDFKDKSITLSFVKSE